MDANAYTCFLKIYGWVSVKPQAWKTGIREIFTIYQKPTNDISEMRDMGVTWWDSWALPDGTIGQRYGATVKRYDLIKNLIEDIQKDPYGRRKIVSLWQEADLRETAGLAPCAFLTIWNVRAESAGHPMSSPASFKNAKGGYLDMCMIQRSGDMLTASGAGGINEIQYSALLMMIARHTGYKPGVFTHFVANEQIYSRHMRQAEELVRRYNSQTNDPKKAKSENPWKVPMMELNPKKTDFYDMTIEDFTLHYYEPIKPQLELELGI